MVVITPSTLFYGDPIHSHKRALAQNINKPYPISQTKLLFMTDKGESVNFITQLDNEFECAGTAIVENNEAKAVFIAGVAVIHTYSLTPKIGAVR